VVIRRLSHLHLSETLSPVGYWIQVTQQHAAGKPGRNIAQLNFADWLMQQLRPKFAI
jgi:hypothetical protein